MIKVLYSIILAPLSYLHREKTEVRLSLGILCFAADLALDEKLMLLLLHSVTQSHAIEVLGRHSKSQTEADSAGKRKTN